MSTTGTGGSKKLCNKQRWPRRSKRWKQRREPRAHHWVRLADSPSPTCATSAKLWNRRRRSDGSIRRKISRRRRSSSLHPIRNGSPAKHYSSREVFVRHLQKMTSTTRKEN